MLRLKLPSLLSIPLFLALTSCGHITVYDREVCGDLGEEGARCAHTLSDKKRDIPKAEWDQERIGMLCMDSQAYTDAETAIDQFCTSYNVCDFKTRESLHAAFKRIRRIFKHAKMARDVAKGSL